MSDKNRELIKAAHKKFVEDFDGREPMKVGVVDGVCWATIPAPSYGINGYAMVPAEGHPWSTGFPTEDSWELDDVLDAHGGITWAQHPWVGFDTAHAWDSWGPEYDAAGISRLYQPISRGGLGGKKWTPALVEYEARRLAIQVARIGFEARRAAQALPDVSELSRFRHLDVENRNTPEERNQV